MNKFEKKKFPWIGEPCQASRTNEVSSDARSERDAGVGTTSDERRGGTRQPSDAQHLAVHAARPGGGSRQGA